MKNISAIIICLLFISNGILYAQAKPNIRLDYGFNVGSYTGSLNYERTDISIPGKGLPLEAVFSYNGMLRYKDFGYGAGWTFTYNYNYTPDTLGILVVHRSSGSEHNYTPNAGGYIPPQGVYDEFEEYAPGKFSLTMKEDQTVYYFDDASHGRLTSIVERNGNTVMLSYTDSLLNTVTDAAGRTLEFGWENGKLASITENNTALERTFTYEYNAAGQMIKMTNPLGYEVNYEYDEYNKMTSYTDEIGTPMTIQYNGNAAVKKVNTCLTTTQFTYDLKNRKTFVVETVGGERFITTYRFDEGGRNVEQTGNCCGNNQVMAYDNNDNVVSRTDGNGREDTYLFDANGNVRKRTDSEGNTEEFSHDLSLNRLIWEKDFLGNIFTYAYDAKGNMVTANYPLGISVSYTYDSEGMVTSFTDGNGNTTNYSYDQYGNQTLITHPDNATYEYVYDALGNLLAEINENGDSLLYEYDAMNQIVKEITPLGYERFAIYDGVGNVVEYIEENGNSTLYEYDGLRRLISTTTPGGIVVTKEYDSRGNEVKVSDGKGRVRTYTYNDLDMPLTETDPAGNVVYYEYDAVGSRISQSDKMGNAMTFEYDYKNRLTKKIDPLGNTYSYKYDVLGRKIEETDARGNTTFYEYDALDRLTKKTNALGSFETMVYDGNDNLIEKIDGNGNVYKYFYDNRNRRIRLESPLQLVTEYTYDALGNRLTKSHASGIVHEHVYDAKQQKIAEIMPNGDVTTYVYDSTGNVIQEILPNGNTIFKEYDKDRHLIRQYDNDGLIIALVYDENGEVIEEMDADSVVTISRYNILNQLIEKEDALGNIETMTYNANGNLLTQTDKNGKTTTFTYNELGLVTQIRTSLDEVTTFEFDAMGNMLSITDAKGNKSTYTYDALNRQTLITYPDNSTKEYQYDANDNIIRRIGADGVVTNYIYDALDRQIEKSYANSTSCIFTYDELSRLTAATNPNSTVQFEYDSNNRMTKEIVNGTAETTYSYDVPNRKKTITYPSGRIVEEEMDFSGRAIRVKQNTTTVADLSYNGYQMTQKAFNNGLTTNYNYNVLAQMESIVVNPGATFHFEYEYNNIGDRTATRALHQQSLSETYAYDNVNRLINYKKGAITNGDIPSPDDQIDFQYDALGNRVSLTQNSNSTTYASNNLNAYTSIMSTGTTISPQYTLSGNMSSDGQNAYTYDADNRLTSVNGNVIYKYDALGRRYQKIVDATTITYYYYQNQMIQEADNNGNTTEYIYAGGKNDYLLAMINTSDTYYYHLNANQSVVGMSNSTGQIVERYEYEPYGTPTIYDGSYTELTASVIGNKFYFTSKELDEESNLYYSRSRHYHHQLGRFMQRDPISYRDGMNLYQYVDSNPINYIDPDGMKGCSSFEFGGDVPKTGRKSFGFTKNWAATALSSAISVKVKGETCNECCSKTNSMGTTYSINVTISGSINYSINGLTYFPYTRALTFAASILGVDIFAGIKIGGSASGSASKEVDACGEVSGSGCVSASVSASGEVSAGTDPDRSERRGHKKANGGFGASIGVEFKAKACYKCVGKSCKWECETSIGGEFKAWVQIEFTWLGVTTRRSEEYSKDLGSAKGNACPGWLPGL